MASVINTNISSLNAQRNLTTSQGELATSLQRLSSGLRINSAKDDAAGLAISERMTTQIRGSNQAVRNANDGVSLAQVAEGALGSLGDSLQRIRELAIQSANATNSASDRAALNVEAQQLKDEIQRVASSTTFNGVNLLDGTFTNQQFQVGPNANETISVANIVNAQTNTLGDSITAQVTTTVSVVVAVADLAIQIADAGGTDVELGPILAGGTVAAQAALTADAVNAISDQTGVFATVSGADVTLISTHDIDVTGALATVNGLVDVTVAASTGGFAAVDISTVEGANAAIIYMDAGLTEVNTARANLGAIQSRFESVVANLTINAENLSAARSRIRDADFAAETANLTRAQILQQAGTAMLAQANSAPQNVLSLLQG
jgi:flagellin